MPQLCHALSFDGDNFVTLFTAPSSNAEGTSFTLNGPLLVTGGKGTYANIGGTGTATFQVVQSQVVQSADKSFTFTMTGSVTAGNSSPLSDGAAAALVMSAEKAKSLGLKGLGYLRAYVTVGVDPALMGIGPLPAIQKLLAKTGLKISDIDLFEVNEAFASQAFYCTRELGIPEDRLNVNGGAIALGHPLGCTGAKLTAQLLYELGRRNGKYGIVSMCIGGGMGAAGLFERIA